MTTTNLIPPHQLTHITTHNNRSPNPGAVEVMAVSGDCALVAYHDVGVIPTGRFNREPIPYDSFKISKAYYGARYDAWSFGFKGNFYIPWGLRDQFLLAMVKLAVELGLISGFTLPRGGVKVNGGKPAKANNGHANGKTPPFDGGTVKPPAKRKPRNGATA